MKNVKSFDDFVRSKSRERGTPITDQLDERKKFWIENVNLLYAKIKKFWLKPYTDKNQVSIIESEIEMNEPFLQKYSIKSILISIGNDAILLKPIASNVIGGYGRVDMIGKNGNKVVNLLLNAKGQWEYKVKTPFVEIHSLDKQGFLQIIEMLME